MVYKAIRGRDFGYESGAPLALVHGVPVGGFMPLSPSGKVFFVDSGVDGGDGTRPDSAVGTLDEAVNLCTANQGDVIYVMPGHAENLAAANAVDVDVAGVTIIGLGRGDDMPHFSYTNAAGEFVIGADNVAVYGLRFTATVTAVTLGIDIEAGATDALIQGCRFDVETTTTDEFNLSIDIKAGCTNTHIKDNFFDMGLGGAVAAVKLTGTSDHVTIEGNRVWGDYSTACLAGDTGASTNVLIHNNLLVNGTGGNIGTEPGIELLTGTTGIVSNNYIVCNLATKLASIAADTVFLFENYYNEDVTGTGGIIGTASADD